MSISSASNPLIGIRNAINDDDVLDMTINDDDNESILDMTIDVLYEDQSSKRKAMVETGSAEKTFTGNARKSESVGSSGDTSRQNSTTTFDSISSEFKQCGVSIPRKDLRDIMATTFKKYLTSTSSQLSSAWGSNVEAWAKCKNSKRGTEPCPCCYLCLLPIVSTIHGGQPEMEHVVACPTAFRTFPNMDTLRYYYPFILLLKPGVLKPDDYEKNTKDRGPTGISCQSLRATIEERRSSGLSMYALWNEYIMSNFEILKQLYLYINCKFDTGVTIDTVKAGFKLFIIRKYSGVNMVLFGLQSGAFYRIFEYCFAVITLWLYEFAYAHRWCNQTKWDVMLNDTGSITNLLGNKPDPFTGKASKINTTWTGTDPINNEIKTNPAMKTEFRSRLTPILSRLDEIPPTPPTQQRVMDVWDKYDDAVKKFRLVSGDHFEDNEEGKKDIQTVFRNLNTRRIIRFTDLHRKAGLDTRQGSSITGSRTTTASAASHSSSSSSSSSSISQQPPQTEDAAGSIKAKKEEELRIINGNLTIANANLERINGETPRSSRFVAAKKVSLMVAIARIDELEIQMEEINAEINDINCAARPHTPPRGQRNQVQRNQVQNQGEKRIQPVSTESEGNKSPRNDDNPTPGTAAAADAAGVAERQHAAIERHVGRMNKGRDMERTKAPGKSFAGGRTRKAHKRTRLRSRRTNKARTRKARKRTRLRSRRTNKAYKRTRKKRPVVFSLRS